MSWNSYVRHTYSESDKIHYKLTDNCSSRVVVEMVSAAFVVEEAGGGAGVIRVPD